MIWRYIYESTSRQHPDQRLKAPLVLLGAHGDVPRVCAAQDSGEQRIAGLIFGVLDQAWGVSIMGTEFNLGLPLTLRGRYPFKSGN